MPSSSSSSNASIATLRHVTARKLAKLSSRRTSFLSSRASIQTLLTKDDPAPSHAERVSLLLTHLKDLGISVDNLGLSARNIELFLKQSQHDASVPTSLLSKWQDKLEHGLHVQAVRYDYAMLFGGLVTEWLQNPNAGQASVSTADLDVDSKNEMDTSSSKTDSSTDSSSGGFQEVGREEMHVQRQQWEQYAFTDRKTDPDAIKAYLDDLFIAPTEEKRITKTPLETMRESIADFPTDLSFDVATLKWCINGILRADLYTGPKREALVDLREKPTVLREMADVLNLDLAAIDSWEWEGPVRVQQRRALNGKYRVFADEEIHQALLLHFIGMHWAVHLKTAFRTLQGSKAWIQRPFVSMTRKDRARRKYFLGDEADPDGRYDTVRYTRQATYRDDYFMTQLPTTIDEGQRGYDDDGSTNDMHKEKNKSPLETKHSLLALATTEMLVNKHLYGRFTLVQSDFKWFGPSLPHSTIFAVLDFLNVPQKWQTLFAKFLATPLVFAQDGPEAEVRMRKCGIPITHIMSDMLGEAVLFCLDYAINKRTNGSNLYRFHDDLWFWGQRPVCEVAWKEMLKFSEIMGLELNPDKSAAVVISKDGDQTPQLSPDLPSGRVKWGFLYLDAGEGRWLIDRKEVDVHIVELRRQLAACRSIFAWVQAWNSYVSRFFTNNFGRHAPCFGQGHVDMVIETFSYIQTQLFGSSSGSSNEKSSGVPSSAVEYLRTQLQARSHLPTSSESSVLSLPDGIFYLPIELGGLELRNPFVTLFAVRNSLQSAPDHLLQLQFEGLEDTYQQQKLRFETTGAATASGRRAASSGHAAWKSFRDELGLVPQENDADGNATEQPFMPKEEYIRFLEETDGGFRVAYEDMQKPAYEASPEYAVDIVTALRDLPEDTLDSSSSKRGGGSRARVGRDGFALDVGKMNPYWKWTVMLYGPDVLERFGNMSLSERGLLPIGLLSLLRSEKVRWQG